MESEVRSESPGAQRCASCGKRIEAGKAYSERVVGGERLLFCCEMCESAFEASSFQRELIPKSFQDPALSFFIDYLPVLRVGGDYAFARLIAGRYFYLFVGDVSGHGIRASLLMSRISSEVESLVSDRVGLHKIVLRLDRLISRPGAEKLIYLTLFCTVVDLETGQLSYLNCGHPPPLLRSRTAQRPRWLGAGNLPVGLFSLAAEPLRLQRVDVMAGDTLVLFTDGLSELVAADGQEIGLGGVERMTAGFAARPGRGRAAAVFSRIRACKGAQDDILLALAAFN